METNKQNEFVVFFNLVKNYVEMEYSEELARKMCLLKYIDVTSGYVHNCLFLKKTVPYTASGIAKLLNKTVDYDID